MCGRFTLSSDPNTIQETFFGVKVPPEMSARYNISPTQPVAVIPNDGENAVDFFTWGLIPSWAKDPSIGSRMINARAETLAEKPSFRSAYRRRRCLILADGFYEWKPEPGSSSKTPYYFRLESGDPFGIAGLWEQWFAPDGSEIKSCTIITTEPNDLVSKVHNRMPVILPEDGYGRWLEVSEVDPERLQPLLAPYPSIEMLAYPVSRLVNSPANDQPELVVPQQ
jgi:putative SOS response-associated peptidase YedK